MFLDVIVAAILILTMVFGFRRGFIYTFTHTLGWVGAIIAGFIFSPWLRDTLAEKTGLETTISGIFSDKFALSSDSVTSSADSLPMILGRSIDTAANQATDLLADKLTSLTMTIICFLLILLAVKLVVYIITSAFSKRRHKGFVGFVDGLLGMIAGMIKGVLFVFIFLALLLPVVNMVSPASTDLILASLDSSYYAKTLYDSNFIVLIVNDFLA